MIIPFHPFILWYEVARARWEDPKKARSIAVRLGYKSLGMSKTQKKGGAAEATPPSVTSDSTPEKPDELPQPND